MSQGVAATSRPDEPTPVAVPTDSGPMPAYLWMPPGRPTGPGIVLFQEIFGITAYIHARCADLAALGYLVIAPQIYWRQGAPVIEETGADALQQAMGVAAKVDWDLAVGDGAASWSYLRDLPAVRGGCGLLGFCFGGGLAFNVAAVTEPDAVVCYYGSALPGLLDLAPKVSAPSLHHVGEADAYLDGPTVARVRAAVLPANPANRFETYPGANHAFDNPAAAFHQAQASQAAWATTTAFLGEHLPTGRRG